MIARWRRYASGAGAVPGLKGLALLTVGSLLLASVLNAPIWIMLPGFILVFLLVLGLPDSLALRLSERRANRAAERGAKEERLHAVLDALAAATILIDARGAVVHANAVATQAFPALRAGASVLHAIRAPDMGEALEAVLRSAPSARLTLIERIPVERSFEVYLQRMGGEVRGEVRGEERNTGASVTGAAGAAYAVIFMHETTAARRLEAMRADFVANASHELRTPLASILGFVETLQGPARNDTAARERFLEIMATQARRMARLIEDLLSLSKIEMNEHIAPEGRIELVGAIRSVLDALSGLARERSVVLEADLPAGEQIINAERDEMLRVIENLIENAIKYGQSGGRVSVSLTDLTDAALGPAFALRVRDYGPGIAPEHLPRLTERFYRADVATSRGQGGTGLGLAIVKHIVTRHRGRLGIESQPGAGASFTVWLPKASSVKK